MEGIGYGLFRSGMDAACNPVRMGSNEKECNMHSGGTPILVIDRNISKRNLGVVFVFQ